jgi:hypothetical protein
MQSPAKLFQTTQQADPQTADSDAVILLNTLPTQ